MSQSLTTKNRETVEEKITSLKVNAFALVREIKALGSISFTDISRGIDLYNEMRRFEIRLIKRALELTNGHQSRAARMLGVKPTTLNEKIKRYGLDPHDLFGTDELSL